MRTNRQIFNETFRIAMDAKGVLTKELSKLIDDFHGGRISRKQLEDAFARGGISKSDLRWLLDEEN